MLFLAGAKLWQFLALGGTILAAMSVLALATPYRVARLTAFLDPWQDPFATGFQLTQSLIAIGSGSWLGTGLGGSVQKLFYLPEAHNDFLFAVFAEEFGFLGVVVLIALFGVVVWRAFVIGLLAERGGHAYGSHVAFGIGVWIGLQAGVNLGVNMGLLPTKGLTLPFLSYGGSSLIVTLAAIGLLSRVHWEAQAPVPRVRGSVP
jgi:cell division protein FtsW